MVSFIDKEWNNCIEPFMEYIKVQNVSPNWYIGDKDKRNCKQRNESFRNLDKSPKY